MLEFPGEMSFSLAVHSQVENTSGGVSEEVIKPFAVMTVTSHRLSNKAGLLDWLSADIDIDVGCQDRGDNPPHLRPHSRGGLWAKLFDVGGESA